MLLLNYHHIYTERQRDWESERDRKRELEGSTEGDGERQWLRERDRDREIETKIEKDRETLLDAQ